MCRAIPPCTLYAFMTWTGTALPSVMFIVMDSTLYRLICLVLYTDFFLKWALAGLTTAEPAALSVAVQQRYRPFYSE